MVGASAARTHRMQIPVAGTGPLFKPAPFVLGTCPAYQGNLRQKVQFSRKDLLDSCIKEILN